MEKCAIPIKILLGNKVDLANEKKSEQITKIEALGLARKYGMEYFETWYSLVYMTVIVLWEKLRLCKCSTIC